MNNFIAFILESRFQPAKNLLAAREKTRQKFSKEFALAPQNIIINTVDEQFLSKLIGLIEEYMDHPEFSVEFLSEKIAMNQSVLYKKVKALTNMSVNDFAKTIRLKKAAQLLEQKHYSIFDVSMMVGFNDRKYFSKEFKNSLAKHRVNLQADHLSIKRSTI